MLSEEEKRIALATVVAAKTVEWSKKPNSTQNLFFNYGEVKREYNKLLNQLES
jgi:hypothetical protein